MNKTTKKVFNMALATTMAAGAVVAVAPTADAAKSFPDVKDPNSAHYDNIYNLVERGIIKGYEDGTFRPGESIKRGHAAKIIAGVLGLDTQNVTNPGFKDISTKNPYYGAIAALANAGIIKGFEDNTYRHNDTLTRGQMSKIIAKAFELEVGDTVNPFTDVKNSQYVNYITALYANGVTTGKTATTFDAKSPVTRAQLASFVVRAETVKDQVENQQTITTTVVEIKNGQLVTAAGTFGIEGDVTKVFNADNAAALKDAPVQLVVDKDSKVVNVKSITIEANNTTFNAGGYTIPQLNVKGLNTTVQNAKVTSLIVEKGKKITLTNVQVAELDIQYGGNIVLDATSTIEKIIIPKNKTIQSIVSKYNEIKDQIKAIVASNTVAPSTGGGGGGGSKPTNPEQPVKTVTATIKEVTDTEIITDKGTFAIEGDLAKVFNVDNNKALKEATISLETKNELVASTNFFAAGIRITSLQSLTLVAQDATFDAGGFEIPELAVEGNNVTIVNVNANTLTVNGDNATIENVIISDTLTIGGNNAQLKNVEVEVLDVTGNIDVSLAGVKVTTVTVSANTALKVDATTVIETLELPEGTKIEDVIPNPPAGFEMPKVVTIPSDDQATDAAPIADSLVKTMLEETNDIYSDYGSLTDSTVPSFTFTFTSASADIKLSVIKKNVEGHSSDLKQDIVKLIDEDNIDDLLNIEEITAESAGKKVTIFEEIPATIPVNEVKDYVADELNKASAKEILSNFMTEEEAKAASVAEFVSKYNNFDIVVKFSDDTTLKYTLTLDVE